MKNLVATALILGMSMGSAVDKHSAAKQPVEPFSHKYFRQIDKTNAALREYANTPCKAPEFQKAAQDFVLEVNLLQGMYKAIPLAEDELTKAHEEEVYFGLVLFSKQVVDLQNNCIKGSDKTVPSDGTLLTN